jgi:hypothetical protein
MSSPAEAIKAAVCNVTREWGRQRKAEERNRSAALNRYARLVPSYRTTSREAAFEVMEEAYLKASDNGTLPTKPRQIMYAARPAILEVTGKGSLRGQYFSQTLLIDYMESHDCDDWDIIWDARGHFLEPHSSAGTPLGTLEVRQYLGERPYFGPSIAITTEVMFPTAGAKNRFGNILFIEKEGFHQILQAARLQERFDVALMSTKGMSVTASRRLLDELAPCVEHIFVLHDLDRSGFSIAGTLGTDSRRFAFANDLRGKFIDIGLRLDDVEAMDLQSEPTAPVPMTEWIAREFTLRRHGATRKEIEFLRTQRVELNAMTSRQLVDFVEAKFREHGVKKVVPEEAVIEQQARRVVEQRLTAEAIAKVQKRIAKRVVEAPLPEDLAQQVASLLERQPELPWDLAVARIIANEGEARR